MTLHGRREDPSAVLVVQTRASDVPSDTEFQTVAMASLRAAGERHHNAPRVARDGISEINPY